MDLYLVRHGESWSNAKWVEPADPPLTPLGHRQAQSAGHALKERAIEALYVSPMERALQTAKGITAVADVPVTVRWELAERHLGRKDTGLPRSEMEQRFPNMKLPPEVDEEGWCRHWLREDEEHCLERVGRMAEDVRAWAESGRYQAVACVIHGGSGNVLIRNLLQIPSESPTRFGHNNCGITHLSFQDDGLLRIYSVNDRRHLVELPESSKDQRPPWEQDRDDEPQVAG